MSISETMSLLITASLSLYLLGQVTLDLIRRRLRRRHT